MWSLAQHQGSGYAGTVSMTWYLTLLDAGLESSWGGTGVWVRVLGGDPPASLGLRDTDQTVAGWLGRSRNTMKGADGRRSTVADAHNSYNRHRHSCYPVAHSGRAAGARAEVRRSPAADPTEVEILGDYHYDISRTCTLIIRPWWARPSRSALTRGILLWNGEADWGLAASDAIVLPSALYYCVRDPRLAWRL
jgi:hypothetical protein